MYIKLVIVAITLVCSDGVIYSSFWAPLFNPRILNYRVDAVFEADAGRSNREEYVKNYGVRGEKLIADLGNGKGPMEVPKKTTDVKFYYTYPGANQDTH